MNISRMQNATRLIMVAAGMITAGTTWGAEFWLRTGAITNTMPDGRQVVMWGFAKDSADSLGDGVITVPGPQLSVASNETLTIHLQNTLPEHVSIVIPGQYAYDSLDPVKHTGGAYDDRVRSFTREAAPLGGKATYVWTSVQDGTFLYHSGSHPSVQMQMGLYGALAVVAPGPAAYPGVPFSSSATLLFSEIDPDVHDAVAGSSFGAGPSFFAADFTNAAAFIAQISGSADPFAAFVASQLSGDPSNLVSDLNTVVGGSSIYDPDLIADSSLSPATITALLSAPEVNQPLSGIPYNGYMIRMNRLLLQDGLANAGIAIPAVKSMTSTIRSYAQYFMVNGRPFTNGLPPIYAGAAGSTILLRMLNAGMDAHVPTLNNAGDFKLIGEDGQQAPYPRSTSASFMPALKTVDALWIPTSPGTNAIYDRRLGLVNATQTPGGMLAYLAVSASNVAAAAPAVLASPVNKIAFVGQSATFSVIASHVGIPSYQWQVNGTNIAGATADTYTIAAVGAVNVGSYRVLVTDGTFSTFSDAATLTVVTQPTPVTVVDGSNATFSVTNLGPAAITYQWQKNGTNIIGATNSSYTFTANYSTDNGRSYRVVVDGPGGPATSAGAILTVTPLSPVITTQPIGTTVPDFSNATFSVVAAGSGLTYQWQRHPPTNLTFTTIAGATSSSYTFSVRYAQDNSNVFRVVVSRSGAAPTASSGATLTVTPVGPQILTQPVSTFANFGQSTSLTATAQASGALSYLWQKTNTVTHIWSTVTNAGITGVTGNALVFGSTATTNLANNGNYRVVVSSANPGAGSVTSSVASLAIATNKPTITAQPTSIVMNAGAALTNFTVTAVGFPSPTYQWQRFNGTAWVNLANGSGASAIFSGVTNPSLIVASGSSVAITVAHAGSYRVIVGNRFGSVTSSVATLTVVQSFAGSPVTSIPIAGGTPSQYPALTAGVPAFTGSSVKYATISLTLTHAEPYDVNVLLTTPNGSGVRKIEIMAGLGPVQQPFETPTVGVYSYGVTNMVLTFDDAAPSAVSTIFPLYAGTYKPTVTTPIVAFPSPAPALPYATNLVSFVGYRQTTAAGWRLYVNDVAQDIPITANDGIISAWSITITVGP